MIISTRLNCKRLSSSALFKLVRAILVGGWCALHFSEKRKEEEEEEEVCSFLLLPQLTRATLKKRIEIWPTV
jgi:hypothetical protein